MRWIIFPSTDFGLIEPLMAGVALPGNFQIESDYTPVAGTLSNFQIEGELSPSLALQSGFEIDAAVVGAGILTNFQLETDTTLGFAN